MRVPFLRGAVVSTVALALAVGTSLVAGTSAQAEGSPTSPDVVSQTPKVSWVPNNGVHALAQDATWIYLGGAFTSLKNPTTNATFAVNHLARVSIATGNPDTTWLPNVNGDIQTLLINTTTHVLYLGGNFTTVGTTARVNLAAVSTTSPGAVQAWYPGAATAVVKTMIQLDPTTIMFGGGFTKIGTAARAHLAKSNTTTGALVTGFAPKIDGNVYTINHPDGASFVYLGGLFQHLGGLDRVFVGAVDTTTAVPTDWNPGNPCPLSTIVCPVYNFVVTPTAVYAAAGGRNPLGSTISYDPVTGARNWTTTADGDNQALVLINGELFVGGHFGPIYGHVNRDTLAAVDPATGGVEPWHPGATFDYPGTDEMMALPDGSLVVGGDQNNIGGIPQNKFAIFPPVASTPDQPPLPSFTSDCNADTCTFDASASTDPDSAIASYNWSFGDLSSSTDIAPTHQYGSSGTFNVTLTVLDDQGAAQSVTQQVSVTSSNLAPVASMTVTCVGLDCTFDGSASHDPDGTVTSYYWIYGDGLSSDITSNPISTHTYATGGTYTAILYIGDNLNAIGFAFQFVTTTAPPPPPPTQWVTNGSFENGSAAGWQAYNTNSVLATINPVGGSHDGTWAERVTNKQAKKAAIVGIQSKTPHWVTSDVLGRSYTGSVWLSGPAGSKITLKLTECPATGACAGSSSVVVTLPASGWIQATSTYKAKKNGDAIRMLVSGSVPAKGALLTDQFSLTSTP